MAITLVPFSWERVMNAVEKVRERLIRATSALKSAGVDYAVVGGNAVQIHVARADESAVRQTKDVDILVRRSEFDSVVRALTTAGFIHRHVAGIDIFLDGPEGRPREGVHLIFAGEKVREHELSANPDVSESEDASGFRVLSLPALVRIKLTAFRDHDRTHLRDMIGVGLIDSTWKTTLPPELATRLQAILDDPNG